MSRTLDLWLPLLPEQHALCGLPTRILPPSVVLGFFSSTHSSNARAPSGAPGLELFSSLTSEVLWPLSFKFMASELSKYPMSSTYISPLPLQLD